MARKHKRKVDYFPHMVKHGRTLTIIEDRFGNDGYAFWFKLLEVLGDSDGHCFRVGNPADIAYLASYSHIPVQTVTEILDLLSMLDAIDPELWEQKVIWCQNFVDGLEGVYSKRDTETPHKPNCLPENTADVEFPGTETHKGKERKGELVKESTRERVSGEVWPNNPKLCQAAYKTFETVYGSFLPDNHRQVDAINQLYKLSSDEGEPEVVLKSMMKKLRELKEDDSTKKGFWRTQPFLPSTLVSLWTRVREHIKTEVPDEIDWENLNES